LSGSSDIHDAEHRALASGEGRGLDRTYLVEAGAGTGKTTVLVDRLLALLRAGVRISRIVAITFTEKAAGELKVRVRGALEGEIRERRARHELGQRASEDGVAEARARGERALDDAVLERLEAALHEVDRAQVNTIHGFCSTLLRERPVEAGVDPGFGVADDLRQSLVLDAVLDEWLRSELAVGLPTAVAEAQALGHGLDRIRELAYGLVGNRDLVHLTPDPVPPAGFDDILSDLRAMASSFAGLADSACSDPEDTAMSGIRAFVREVEAIDHLPADLRPSFVVQRVRPAPKKNRGRKGNWRGDTLAEMRASAAEMDERLAQARALLSHNATVNLVGWLGGFLTAYEREKTRLGLLDFQDLLEKARDMVRDNVAVREHFKDAFDRILLDEFQDTDPLQCELAFLLCEKKGASARDWSDVELEPGKLFLVGDPKQSIYRFRRADIETYEQAKSVVARSGAVLTLTENFRTRPSITDGVNAVFAPAMHPPEDGRMYQPEYAPLSPFRERDGEGPGILLLPSTLDDDESHSADEVRRAEARTVAAFLAASRANGALRVFDRDGERWRSAELRDIAVLFHATNALDAYEEAFTDYGLDYRIAGGKKFYARREVKELATVLAAVDDPHDLVSVVGALRTPFLGASDEEILLHRHATGSLNYAESGGGGVEAVEQAFGLLRDLHDRRSSLGPTRLLWRLFEKTKALELFLMKPAGEQRHANLLKVVELADGLEKVGSLSFSGFVKWLGDVQQLTPEEAESPLSEEGDDFVRMLTIHKAKGLEFPVTVLADLGRRKVHRDEIIVDRMEERLAFGLGAAGRRLATEGYEELGELERRRQTAELVRLLYVGMTRARDALIVPWFESGNRAGHNVFFPLLSPLREADGPVTIDTSTLDLDVRQTRPTRLDIGAAIGTDTSQTNAALDLAEWTSWRESFAGRHSRPLTIVTPSATDEGRSAEGSRGDRARPGSGRATGAEVGTLVHRVMERLELSAPEAARELALRVAGSSGMSRETAEEAAEIIRGAQSSPVLERARGSRRLWREVPFCVAPRGALREEKEAPAAARQEAVIEGVMDLVFEEEDCLVIVDYKTDRIGPGGTTELAGRYRGQAEAYALALAAATGRQVKEVVLLFMRGPAEAAIAGPADPKTVEDGLNAIVAQAAPTECRPS
jgi:ATP-dependent helicase/nuclease subunit A